MAGGVFAGLTLCALVGFGFAFGSIAWDAGKCLIVGALIAFGGLLYAKMVSPRSVFWVCLPAYIVMVKIAWRELGRIEIGVLALMTGIGALLGVMAGPFVVPVLLALALGWYVGTRVFQAMPDAEE